MSYFDLRDGRLGAIVGKWCYLGGPVERAFLIVARTHSTQADGAPVELKTLIEYEPRGEAEDHFNLFVSGSSLSLHLPGTSREVDFHRHLYIDHSNAIREGGHDDIGLPQETRAAIDGDNR